MSVDHDEEMATDLAIECARQDERDGPFAGEDPPEEYLAEEAERFAQLDRDREHGGRECDCPAEPVAFASEPPF